jgi:hypothetical protein
MTILSAAANGFSLFRQANGPDSKASQIGLFVDRGLSERMTGTIDQIGRLDLPEWSQAHEAKLFPGYISLAESPNEKNWQDLVSSAGKSPPNRAKIKRTQRRVICFSGVPRFPVHARRNCCVDANVTYPS